VTVAGPRWIHTSFLDPTPGGSGLASHTATPPRDRYRVISRTIRRVLPAASSERARDDCCPGVLRLIDAVDGGLARIRLPGGLLGADALRALAAATRHLGDGRLELTSRASVQIRALADGAGAELAERLAAAGLWPSESHERVRNIAASPLAGLDSGADLTELVRDLDRTLCARPALAQLSGRFLFGLDDGRGDIAALEPDVLAVVSADAQVGGLPVSPERVVEALLAFAEAFLAERADQRSDAWRVTDLADGVARVRARAAMQLGVLTPGETPAAPVWPDTPPAGLIDQLGGGHALVALAPLGRLTADQADWLAAAITGRSARVTPWRSIVVPDVAPTLLAAAEAAGFGIAADSPWRTISACAGRPGCGKALADVQHDALAAAGRWPGRLVHWSGCERRCGRPARTEVDVVATEHGYRIEDAADA